MYKCGKNIHPFYCVLGDDELVFCCSLHPGNVPQNVCPRISGKKYDSFLSLREVAKKFFFSGPFTKALNSLDLSGHIFLSVSFFAASLTILLK